MSPIDFVFLLIIAAVCGALGKALAGESRGGWLVTIALGFIGALLGTWLARQMELPELFVVNVGDSAFPIVWAVIGSALFVALLSLLTKSNSKGK